MDLSKIRKIYMIGIKGVGMTMLAQFLAGKGVEVSGSDGKEKYMTDKVLKKAGIKVIEEFNENNILAEADLIIYSTAYNKENNIEVAKALSSKKNVLTYAEALGEIFNEHYGIAVVGTHGKTTTTAWLGYVLEKAGLSPNVMVGARVEQFKGSSLIGKSDYLIAELDEYQNKLKYFNPQMVLLSNIEYDHPDFFPTQDDYKKVFIDFIKDIPNKGFLIANFDDPITRKIAPVNCRGKVISYGIHEAADYVAYDIKQLGNKQYFKVHLTPNPSPFEGEGNNDDDIEELGDFCIGLPGKYNISNALAVIVASVELGVELRVIREHLEEFKGTDRRMQVLGKFRGATIIDDYAHHPTEVKAALSGAKEIYKDNPSTSLRTGKIIVVFHPHTFTRTRAMLDDFANSFSLADEVIVLDIYGSAREKQGGVSSEDLVKKILETHNNASVQHIPTLEKCEKYLRENIEQGDVVILMGAGDVFRIGENLVKS